MHASWNWIHHTGRWALIALGLALLTRGVAAIEPEHGEVMRALRAAEEHVGIWQRYPLAGVPQLLEAPAVDGVVDEREWFGAARIGHMVEWSTAQGVSDDTTLLLGYTAERLYLAFRFERPDSARRPDPRRDFFEASFDLEHGHRRYINFAFGLEGLLWDGIGPGLDPMAWSGDWEYAARETDFGWEGEMSVPFADFGLDGPPAPGTIWGADFVRNERTPQDRIAQWSYRGEQWGFVRNLGHVLFLGRPLAIRAEGLGWLEPSQEAGVRLLLVNREDAAVKLEVELALHEEVRRAPLGFYRGIESAMAEEEAAAIGSPLASEVANALQNYAVRRTERTEVTVPAGRSQLVTLTQPDEPGEYLAGYAVREGEALLAGGLLPFRVSVPLAIRLTSYLYSAGTVAYGVELRRIRDRVVPGSRLVVRALDAAGQEVARDERPDIADRDLIEGTLHFEPESGATFHIEAAVYSGDEPVAVNTAPLQVPERPAWLGNAVGRSARVPPPWVPLQADPQGARTLAIAYDWNAGGLLPDFTVFGREILAAPPALEFVDPAGQPLPFERTVFRLEYRDDEEARYVLEGTLGDAGRVRARIRVEFDGFLWCEIETELRQELGAARLRLALKPEYARLYTASPAVGSPRGEHDGSGRAAAGVPPEGVTLPFNPSPWLGGMEGGVQFFAEHTRDWQLRDEGAVIRIRPGPEAVELSVTLVDRPVPAGERLAWAFGLMPTPNRVKTPGWGDYRIHQYHGVPELDLPDEDQVPPAEFQAALEAAGALRRDKGIGVIILGAWTELFGWPVTYEPERQRRLRQFVRAMHSVGIRVLLYTGWGIHTGIPEWADFGSELITLPVRNAGWGTFRQEPAALYSDLFVYRLAEMVREYGIDGVYLDSQASVTKSFNYGGPRWVDDQGRLRGTYPVLAYRDLYKRMYKMFHGELIENGVVYSHQSPPAAMAVESFVDVRCPTEFVQMYEGEFNRAFLEQFMANCAAEQFGLFSELTNKDWMPAAKKMVAQCYALGLPLNVQVKALTRRSQHWIATDSYALRAQPQWPLWAAQRWVDIETAVYLPWWRNAEYLTTAPADEQVLTALWLQPGEKALLCVSNLHREPRRIETRLDLERLGFGALRAEDAITGETVAVEGDRIALEVDFERFRLLKLSPERP